MPIIESIVSEHAEEAAFLWLLRNAAIAAPHYSLKDLAELDDRVEAHIDGLRIAGDGAWPFCAEGLEYQESGEVFAAALIALEGEDAARIRQVYAAVEAAPQTADGLVSAIGWTPQAKLQGKVASLLGSASPFWRRIGIAACSAHRVDCGRHVSQAVQDTDPQLRARALRAAGETARQDLLPLLRAQIRSDSVACAFWSAWSAVLLGDRAEAVAQLGTQALQRGPEAAQAIQVLLRTLSAAAARDWLRFLAQIPDRQRDLIVGCGVSGDPYFIPWLIKQMGDAPESARVAGESFSFITGVDIAHEDLEGEWPEGFEAGPTEQPEDEDVSPDPDEDLPWPDPERIAAWWKANAHRFQAGTRYLVGEPVNDGQCQRVLRTGMQRQRNAAALELALMHPAAPLFETRAPGFRQRELLLG
jgi:uncharacterized protein (TIGR02270 family)